MHVWISSLLLFNLYSHAANTPAVSSKCLAPLKEALEQSEEGSTRVKKFEARVAPVECQYYKLSELDSETQSRVIQQLKRKGVNAALNLKLSEVLGTLMATNQKIDSASIGGKCELFLVRAMKLAKNFSFPMKSAPCLQTVDDFFKTTFIEEADPECERVILAETSDVFKNVVIDEMNPILKKNPPILQETLTKLYSRYRIELISDWKSTCRSKK